MSGRSRRLRQQQQELHFELFVRLELQHNVEFVSLKEKYDTTTAQGRLFVTILMALAQFEREQTSERTRDAAQARSERGLRNGGRLLGYDPDPEHKARLLHPDLFAELARPRSRRITR